MALEMNFEVEEIVEKIAKVPKPARLGIVVGVHALYDVLTLCLPGGPLDT